MSLTRAYTEPTHAPGDPMATMAPKAVQRKLLLLLCLFKNDLEALFPHNIDVWIDLSRPDGAIDVPNRDPR